VEYNRRAVGTVLLIKVVSFKGRPMGRELSARFGEGGGTVGRADNSTLALSDPDRHISRTHASVAFQAGGFVITDMGTKNPLILNGRPLGQGNQAKLGDGDQIKVGDYVLQVSLASQGAGAPVHIAESPRSGPPKDDPLAALGGPAARASDPFAGLIPSEPEPPRGLGPGPLPHDPLAAVRGRDPSVDELFGLKQSSGPDILTPEPPRGDPFAQRGGGIGDPFELLGRPNSVPAPSIPDNAPELYTPYVPPIPKLDPALAPKAPPLPPTPQPPPRPQASPPPAPAAPARPPASSLPTGPAEEALLRAFLEGAGIPEGRLPKGLTPETMETIGKVLREAVHGTLDLLRARGLTKSEMRADVTMIMAQDNNPLKFSPTPEAALAHLLSPQGQGFTAPLTAMREAYDDLRAHQLGVLAGMRAALDEVLKRFSPETLQDQLADPTFLDSLIASKRKAKLWQLFVERYENVAEEARENFHTAFGKAFLSAYDDQIKRLRADRRG
jgi:FHA domain-containing protein